MLYIKLISVYIILLVVGYTSRKNDLWGGGGRWAGGGGGKNDPKWRKNQNRTLKRRR